MFTLCLESYEQGKAWNLILHLILVFSKKALHFYLFGIMEMQLYFGHRRYQTVISFAHKVLGLNLTFLFGKKDIYLLQLYTKGTRFRLQFYIGLLVLRCYKTFTLCS